jgi:hypothetical protein
MTTPTGSESFRARNAHLYPPHQSSRSEVREADLQAQIAARLQAIGPRCYYVWHRTDKPTTCAVGTPDFVGWYDEKPFAIEVKVRDGKLSAEQIDHQHWARCAGAVCWVVRSMGDLEDALATLENLTR